MTGKRFGRLTVLSFDHVSSHRERYWKCLCDCGNEVVVRTSHLITGHSTSCGCSHFNRETLPKKYPRLYVTWKDTKTRRHAVTTLMLPIMNGTVDEVLQSVLIGTHLFRFVSGRWITATVMILQSTAKTMTRVIHRITADGSQFESRILTGENGKEKTADRSNSSISGKRKSSL